MTLAVCVRCGHEKLGAFTPCADCGAAPSDEPQDRARALLLSDRFVPAEQLRADRGGDPSRGRVAALLALVAAGTFLLTIAR